MIYLMGEIVLYLLAALLLGAGAGWLLRSRAVALAAPGESGPRSAAMADRGAARPADVGDAALEIEAAELQWREAELRVSELQLQVDAHASESDALARRLAGAEGRIRELERERELQNRALQILHQQLELAVERRAARVIRSAG